MELQDEHFAEEGIKLMDPSAEFTAEPDQQSIEEFYERRRQLDTDSNSPRSHASPRSARSSLKDVSFSSIARLSRSPAYMFTDIGYLYDCFEINFDVVRFPSRFSNLSLFFSSRILETSRNELPLPSTSQRTLYNV